MRGRFVRVVLMFLGLVLVLLLGWDMTYRSSSDPKNIKYVMWKAGFYGMDLDEAVGTMTGDATRDKLVLGKTKPQLRKRFGYLLEPADVSPYLRACYLSSSWKGKDVLFIRRSPWMVVFDGDVATELILIKGC